MKKLICLLLLTLVVPVFAATPSISWFTIDRGGGRSSGGGVTISGTVGQPDANYHTGGPITAPFNSAAIDLTGGFWGIFNIDTVPVITSTLTGTANVGSSFNYKITAQGTIPMIFQAQYLPAGLTLNGNTISGTILHGGMASIKLIAQNHEGTHTEFLTLTFNSPPGSPSHKPKIVSGPDAYRDPAIVGDEVSFFANATDSDDDVLSYQWDFGDGFFSHDPQPTHTFSAPGCYEVTLTVRDATRSVSKDFNLSVYPNTLAVCDFDLDFDFRKPSKSELKIEGTALAPQPMASGTRAILDIGPNLHRDYALNASGNGGNSRDSFEFHTIVCGDGHNVAEFEIRLKNRSDDNDPNTLFSQLQALGFTQSSTGQCGIIIQVPVSLKLVPPGQNAANVPAQTITLSILYETNPGKSGDGELYEDCDDGWDWDDDCGD